MEPKYQAAFVFTDDGEVFAIPSILQQGWLEYVEVNAGAYPAIYTADGWVVEATSAKWDVTLTVTGVRDEDGLRQRLAAVDPEFKHGDDLVAYADRLLAQRWEGRWPKRPAWLAKRLPATGLRTSSTGHPRWTFPPTLAQARNGFLDHTEADSKEVAVVKASRYLPLAAVLAATAAIGFSIGKMTTATAAEASAANRYTLRLGDKMTVPAVGQLCAVYTEGGAPELFCSRPRHAHHQVTIFRDSILLWKVGNPDRPAWSGRP